MKSPPSTTEQALKRSPPTPTRGISYTRCTRASKNFIDGACGFCAKSHGVKDTLKAAGIAMLSDHQGHASVRKYIADGYQLLIF